MRENTNPLLVLVGRLRFAYTLSARRSALPPLFLLSLYNGDFGNLEKCGDAALEVLLRLRTFDVFRLFHGVIMRLFVSVLLLIFATGFQQAKPDTSTKESSVNKGNAQQETRNEDQPPTKMLPDVTIQECDDCSFAVEAPNARAKQDDPYDAGKDSLYRAYLKFTIAGVVIAMLGVGAIYLQTRAIAQSADATARSAKETARAAKATEDSVTLQEIALKQWVNIGNWSADVDLKTSQLAISFHVINPTKIPLTLLAVLVKFRAGTDIKRHDVGIADVLAPDNPFVADIDMPLSEQEIADFIDSKPIFVGIECSVLFIDGRDESWEQIFKRQIIVDRDVAARKLPPTVMQIRNLLRKSTSPEGAPA